MKLRLRALVLAAGHGERLRPLTGSVPKPLLPVAGRPLAAHSLERLASFGCEAAALNLHHLGEMIERRLGTSADGMPLTYSREPELLGTLGALRPLRGFLAAADLVLLVNGDSLCRWPLRRLVRRHLASGAEATLLLSRRADAGEFGGVTVDEKGRVLELRSRRPLPANAKRKRYVFAGAHVLSPALLGRLGEGNGPGDIVTDLYRPLLAEGALVQSVLTRTRWHDLGTPRRYLDGAYEWARGRWPGSLWRRRWIARTARVGRRTRIRHSVIEADCRIERGAIVEGSLVLTGAAVGPGSRVGNCIVAPGVRLPAKTWVEWRLITPLKSGRDPGANDSVVGDLVYTPIERNR